MTEQHNTENEMTLEQWKQRALRAEADLKRADEANKRMRDCWGYESGVTLIGSERTRQAWRWPLAHDILHARGELIDAAVCYLQYRSGDSRPDLWPWEDESWKPRDPKSNLVRAGAMIAAEIDRRNEISRMASEIDSERFNPEGR